MNPHVLSDWENGQHVRLLSCSVVCGSFEVLYAVSNAMGSRVLQDCVFLIHTRRMLHFLSLTELSVWFAEAPGVGSRRSLLEPKYTACQKLPLPPPPFNCGVPTLFYDLEERG